MPGTDSATYAAVLGVLVAVLLWAPVTGRALAQVVTLVHELGHAFGLDHVCQPASSQHTNLMATSGNMNTDWYDPSGTPGVNFKCSDVGGDQGDRSMGFSDFTITVARPTGELATVDQMSIITGNIAAVVRALGPGVVTPELQPRF